MTFEVGDALEGGGGVDLDHVAMHSGKQVTSIAEGTLRKEKNRLHLQLFVDLCLTNCQYLSGDNTALNKSNEPNV